MVSKFEAIDKFCHPGVEKAVLSSVIKNHSLLVSNTPELKDEHFLSPIARELFVCIQSLFKKGIEKYDLEVIVNEVQNFKHLKYINSQDGMDYIKIVFDSKVPDDLVKYYLEELVEKANKYKLFEVSSAFQNKILTNLEGAKKHSFDDIVSDFENSIYKLTIDSKQEKDTVDFSKYIQTIADELNRPPIDVLGIKCGWDILDSALNGFQNSTLTVVAARAKVGKSSCLAGWGINICYHSNVPVLYLDTEMGEKMFGYRMISNLTKIPYKELTNRTFTHDNDTIEALDLAVELIESGRFKYKYLPRFTPDSLRYEIKKFIKQEGYGVVFFDYIKLPDGLDLKFANETQQLGYLATALKSIGGELGIPIVTAVQYNRDAVGKEGNLSSAYISASDRILHYADTILSLRRLSMKELAFVNSRFGVDANINGCMQILDSRSSPPDMDGIYLSMDLSRASITEASEQPSSGEMVGAQGDSDD